MHRRRELVMRLESKLQQECFPLFKKCSFIIEKSKIHRDKRIPRFLALAQLSFLVVVSFFPSMNNRKEYNHRWRRVSVVQSPLLSLSLSPSLSISRLFFSRKTMLKGGELSLAHSHTRFYIRMVVCICLFVYTKEWWIKREREREREGKKRAWDLRELTNTVRGRRRRRRRRRRRVWVCPFVILLLCNKEGERGVVNKFLSFFPRRRQWEHQQRVRNTVLRLLLLLCVGILKSAINNSAPDAAPSLTNFFTLRWRQRKKKKKKKKKKGEYLNCLSI